MEKYKEKVESPAVLPLRDNLWYIQPGELPSNFFKCQSFGIKTPPPLAASSLLGQLTSHPYASIPCSEMQITVLASWGCLWDSLLLELNLGHGGHCMNTGVHTICYEVVFTSPFLGSVSPALQLL